MVSDLDLKAVILIVKCAILIYYYTVILIIDGRSLIFDLDHFQSDLLYLWMNLN